MYIQEIDPTQTMEKLKKGAILIDVREEDEIEQIAYKVENQLQIPMSVFESEHIIIPKDKELVIACKAGGRSFQVASYLTQIGYDINKVFNLEGGMMNWLHFGMETE